MSGSPEQSRRDASATGSAASAAAMWLDFLARQGTSPLASPAATQLASPPFASPDFARLQQEHLQRHAQLWHAMLARRPDQPPPVVAAPEPGDRRFAASDWSESPVFDYLRQAYLINASFFTALAETLPAPDESMRNRLRFMTRQYVDALAPSNFAATNPEFIKTALATRGESITAGIRNLLADLEKGRVSMTDEAAFEVGRNLAVTPGAVVYENELMQLIQYAPATDKVAQRPLIIVPPCINKFYILDLQPENSFVRYAVDQGLTVFMVSWRNVKADLGHLTWDDYVERGALQALRVGGEICGTEQVNALGFCVGGTILASALAVAKARGEDPAASLTLLTTLLDFSDAGEISNFIDEASVAAREATIGKGGLLRASELAAAFSALRAKDLIWQYVVGNYLKGGKPPAFDLLYWNCDSTNLPGPFATWYLRNMYLDNALREPGRLRMCGVDAALPVVDMPAYILATQEDHIVPWRSAYVSRELLGGDSTFVLGASGHVAGVINAPAKNKRGYWTNAGAADDACEWLAGASEHKGSWWPHWMEWLRPFRGPQRAPRRKPGGKGYAPVEPAPGRYVKEQA